MLLGAAGCCWGAAGCCPAPVIRLASIASWPLDTDQGKVSFSWPLSAQSAGSGSVMPLQPEHLCRVLSFLHDSTCRRWRFLRGRVGWYGETARQSDVVVRLYRCLSVYSLHVLHRLMHEIISGSDNRPDRERGRERDGEGSETWTYGEGERREREGRGGEAGRYKSTLCCDSGAGPRLRVLVLWASRQRRRLSDWRSMREGLVLTGRGGRAGRTEPAGSLSVRADSLALSGTQREKGRERRRLYSAAA